MFAVVGKYTQQIDMHADNKMWDKNEWKLDFSLVFIFLDLLAIAVMFSRSWKIRDDRSTMATEI